MLFPQILGRVHQTNYRSQSQRNQYIYTGPEMTGVRYTVLDEDHLATKVIENNS